MLNKCRVCLCMRDNMKFLTEDEPETKQFIAMYTSINNFEWISNDQNSSYLCAPCQTDLEISYEFRNKCLESYKVIQKEINSRETRLESLSDAQEHDQERSTNNEEIIVKNNNENPGLEIFCEDLDKSTKDEQDVNYNCIVCSYILSTIQGLSSHMSLKHKDVKRNWCCLCNSIFFDLQNHRKFAHDNLEAPRIESDTLFETKSLLCSENYSDTGQLTSKDENVRATVNEDEIDNKEQSVNNRNKYCGKCDKKVRSLSIHMRKVHSKTKQDKPKKFTCYVCTREMKSTASLRAHLKVHKGDTPHKCSFCGKPNKSKGQLVEHERTHTGEKPFICNVCGKGFAQAGALGTHAKIHTGRPEVCTFCDKRFCRPSELRLHLRKHSGEKPFLCTECGKAFAQKSHLMEHMKTHSEVRPFKCLYCDKAFKQKSLLTTHLQIHSGYKPYQCKLCEYACFKAYRLQQHIMKLHDNVKTDKEYVCPVCQKDFSSQALLKGHVTSSHNAIL